MANRERTFTGWTIKDFDNYASESQFFPMPVVCSDKVFAEGLFGEGNVVAVNILVTDCGKKKARG